MKNKFVILLMGFALGVLMIVSADSKCVYAKDYSTTNGKHTFKSAWEDSVVFCESSVLEYGFDTFLINEDYVHSNRKYSQAYIKNADGTFKGRAALYTSGSSKEVKHSGSTVTYGVIYQ